MGIYDGRSGVRPPFVWLALGASVVLAGLAGLSAWEYLESVAIRDAVADIRRKGEPVSLNDLRQRPVSDEALTAERSYRAAAVLAFARPQELALVDRARDAARKGEWPGELMEQVRRQVSARDDALRLLDRAAPLPFEGFALGATGSALNVFPLARLAGLRTLLLILDRDDTGAIESSYAELRLRPAIEWAWGNFRASVDEVERVGQVLSDTRPSPEALARLGRALADLDRDDALKRWFLGRRAALFEFGEAPGRPETAASGWRPLLSAWRLPSPWRSRQLRVRLEMLAKTIDVLDQPWPDRASAVARLYDGIKPPVDEPVRLPDVVVSHQIVDDLALVRSARIAVAVEQYRRAHGDALPSSLDELTPSYLSTGPIDPYSGRAMVFHREARSYSVYSVGTNRRDDNGDFVLLRFAQGVRELRDVGMRIRYR